MANQNITSHCLSNGLKVLVEPMSHVKSASFALLIPAGSIYDVPGKRGKAAVLAEHIFRGAGNRTSREITEELEFLGVQYRSAVGPAYITFSGSTLGTHLSRTLKLFASIVREPHFPEHEFEPSRDTVLQSLRTVEDEPRELIFRELKQRCYPSPWGEPTDGNLQDVPLLTCEMIQNHFENHFGPQNAILSIAGDINPDEMIRLAEDFFQDWKPQDRKTVQKTPTSVSIDHRVHSSEQTQIGIAYHSVPYRHPDYYKSWAAVSVLSGGMSARLFTEVREKRGLCYSIYAALHTLKDEARVLCYAGTTADRAQETLDVTIKELQKLQEGILDNELDCCKARARSALVMHQESTMQRASSLATNWYHLGRILPIKEVEENINAITTQSLQEFIEEHPPRNFTLMTIGPSPLMFHPESQSS